MDLAAWLHGLGLKQYEEAFRANHIDRELLATLTADDLRDMGIASVGHRKKLLAAIAALTDSVPPSPAAADPEPHPQAERRQLTVMFVDLVGSTALSQRLDPEEMGEVLRAYQNVVIGELVRFEGQVARFLGDGVLAYFGWPTAHEDDAERAVRAALSVITAVEGLNGPGDMPLKARIGIATGLVVVGETVGEGSAREEVAVGQTPNLAARLQALAEPGAVVLASSTYRLLGRLFEYDDLGSQQVKGFAEPVQVWRVIGPSSVDSRFEALRGASPGRMVGREQELALLLGRWEQCKNGEGQVLLLSGEAGVGKSRLVRALYDRLPNEHGIRIRLQCSLHHMHSALWPLIKHLERASRLDQAISAEARRHNLAAVFTSLAPEVEPSLPLLFELLDISGGSNHPILYLSPQQKKRRLFNMLLTHFHALSKQHSLLIILEDAQWIDPTSREIIDAIIEDIGRLPVLLIIVIRPDVLPLWAEHQCVTMLALSRLSGRQIDELITLAAGGRALPSEVVEQIRVRADGVPLFIEELTKTIIEAGIVHEVDGRLELAAPLPSLAIPATLQDSLMARLDRLAVVKEVAQIAACIGRQFSYDLIDTVAHLPADQLIAALHQLVTAQLISRRGAPPEAIYTFKHALLQDAAHQSMLKGRRQQIHAAIAHALESRPAEEGQALPEIVAHHFTEAGLAKSAINCWLRAGERAAGRSAMVEAAAALHRALALITSLQPTKERAQLELRAQAALGRALITTQGQAAPETGQAFDAALALTNQLDDTEEVFGILAGIFVYRMVRADLANALAIAERMLAAARANGGDVANLMAHRCLGVVRFYLGDHVNASRSLERAIELYRDGEHAPLAQRFAYDPKAAALAYLGLCLVATGRTAEAQRRFDQALTHAQVLDHQVSWANTLAHVGLGRMVADDLAGVRANADALSRIAADQCYPYWTAHAALQQGWLHLDQPNGLAVFADGIDLYRASGARMAVPTLLALEAAAQLRHGQQGNASARLEEACCLMAETGERWYEPEILRLSGEALAAADRRQEAEIQLSRAIRTAQEQGADGWRLRAEASLAHLY